MAIDQSQNLVTTNKVQFTQAQQISPDGAGDLHCLLSLPHRCPGKMGVTTSSNEPVLSLMS